MNVPSSMATAVSDVRILPGVSYAIVILASLYTWTESRVMTLVRLCVCVTVACLLIRWLPLYRYGGCTYGSL